MKRKVNFKEKIGAAAGSVFGSGWVWLVVNNGKLKITTTPNQDTPISKGMMPVMGIDVWEHAYYLKYQNKRAEYVENIMKVINWDKVLENIKGN